MRAEQFNTRLDSPHDERVHRYMEQHGLSKADATRRLIQRGLAAETVARKVATYLAWLGLLAWTAAAWFWGVHGGMAAPFAAAGAPEVEAALWLMGLYWFAAVIAEAVARGAIGKHRLPRPRGADE